MTLFRTLGVGTIFSIALLGTACGNGPPASSSGGGGGSTCAGSAKATGLGTAVKTINETDSNVFDPATASVKVGDVVQFTNAGSAQHNATFDGNDCLTSTTMSGGDTWQVKFTTAGTYTYNCSFHVSLGMKGTITVS